MIFNGYPPSTVGIAVVALLVFVAILYLFAYRLDIRLKHAYN